MPINGWLPWTSKLGSGCRFRSAIFLAHPLSFGTLRLASSGFPALYHSEEIQLSLSRLNHRLPRGQTDPEVMQGTTDFHHEIADAVLPQPDPVFDDATAFDTTVDMLDPQPTVMQGLVGQLLFQGAFLAAGFLGRH